MRFKILKKSRHHYGRLGVIETPHGVIHTPAFIPVGTQATVKGLTINELTDLGIESVLCNTYHLYLRPGDKVVKKMGGLHKFMNWDRPIWTDSGGFQTFSLGYALEHGVGKIANMFPGEKGGIMHGETGPILKKEKLTRITEDGVEFRSHLDGSKHFFTPESSIKIQQNLGADMIFAFDECTSPLHDYQYTKKSLARTHRWAKRCLMSKATSDMKQALYGVIQGGAFRNLREEAARFISGMDFDGIGVGGPLGNTKKDMYEILSWLPPFLPTNKPRHLLGIGAPEDIIEAVKQGMDTFDCVTPTRLGRNGSALLTTSGSALLTTSGDALSWSKGSTRYLNIKSGRYLKDSKPIDKKCRCYTCQNHTRSYISHLFQANEMLGPILTTIHNLYFMQVFMEGIRKSLR